MSSGDLVLNWGIVATGYISQDFCIAVQSLKSDKQVIKAVGARSLEDAQKFAERFGISHAYGSYDGVFADKEVNVVYIGSINTTHKENCLKAINAGKHVLCEKPMTMTIEDQEEVFKAATEKGVFFMEGLWTRFFPTIEKLREELKNNSIGEVKFFSSTFCVPISHKPRIKEKALGGSTILDIGIYPIQLACLVMNHEKPIKISACGHLMHTGVDECAVVTLLYPGGRVAQINYSSNCSQYAPTFIVGEKGSIQIPELSWCPTEIIVNEKKYQFPVPDLKANYVNSSGLKFEAEAVRDAISKGLKEHPYAKFDDSRLIMHIISEALDQLGFKP